MKFGGILGALSIIFLSATVQADIQQYLDSVPTCGLNCITTIVSQFDCNTTKTPCICTNKTLPSTLNNCVSQNCTVIERLQIINITHLACSDPIQSRQANLLSTAGLGIVAFFLLNLRLYSRWTLGGSWNADDRIMVCVSACLVPFMVIGCLATALGFGQNIYNLTPTRISLALAIFFFGEIAYVTLLGLCKVSVLLFYIRIFSHYPLCRTICNITLSLVIICTTLYQFLVLFQCWPIPYNWEGWKTDLFSEKRDGRCLDLNALGYTSAGINILQDVVILIIPIPWLINLNCSLRKKIQILAMFGIGIFITTTSILRLLTLPSFKATKDPTWEFTDPMYWTAIEVYVAIIIPSLPAVRSLVSSWFPRMAAAGREGLSGGRKETDGSVREASGSGSGSVHRREEYLELGGCGEGCCWW